MVVAFFLIIVSPEKNVAVKKKRDLPQIEFEKVKNYHITLQGIDSIIKAKKAFKFADRDEMYDVETEGKRGGFHERLLSKIAVLKDGIFYFSGDVDYKRSDGISLKSDSLEYALNDEILISRSPFELRDEKGVVRGKSFKFNRKTGIVKAKKIKSTIIME